MKIIGQPEFNKRGHYKLDDLEQCAAAMLAALRSIAMVPHAYHAQDAAVQRDEMQRIASELVTELRYSEAFDATVRPNQIDDDGTLDTRAEAREQDVIDAANNFDDGGVQ